MQQKYRLIFFYLTSNLPALLYCLAHQKKKSHLNNAVSCLILCSKESKASSGIQPQAKG